MRFVKTIHVYVQVKSVIVKFSCSRQVLDSVQFTLVEKKYTLVYFKKYFLLFLFTTEIQNKYCSHSFHLRKGMVSGFIDLLNM